MQSNRLHPDVIKIAFIAAAALMVAAAAVIGVLVYATATASASAGLDISDDLRVLTTSGTDDPMVRLSLPETRTVMQSFAFDPDAEFMYVSQVTGSGSSSRRSRHLIEGDLTVSKIRMSDGELVSSMWLQGFGHGQSIGVEARPDGDYLWTETDSVLREDGRGWGRRIARVRWVDGATIQASSDAVERFECPDGALATSHCSPALDVTSNRIAIRYMDARQRWRAALYRLSDYAASGPQAMPVADVVLPDGWGRIPGTDGTRGEGTAPAFQGFATSGDKIYLLHGSQALADSAMNAQVTMLDWQTGELEFVPLNSVFEVSKGFAYRQPQGIAVLHSGGSSRICVGFASRRLSHGEPRVASFAYMVP